MNSSWVSLSPSLVEKFWNVGLFVLPPFRYIRSFQKGMRLTVIAQRFTATWIINILAEKEKIQLFIQLYQRRWVLIVVELILDGEK